MAVATTEGNNQRRRVFWFHCSCSEAGHDLDTVQNEKNMSSSQIFQGFRLERAPLGRWSELEHTGTYKLP